MLCDYPVLLPLLLHSPYHTILLFPLFSSSHLPPLAPLFLASRHFLRNKKLQSNDLSLTCRHYKKEKKEKERKSNCTTTVASNYPPSSPKRKGHREEKVNGWKKKKEGWGR